MMAGYTRPVSKAEATELAKQLKARMKTKGWKIDVWENLGWHYAIRSKWMSVHPGKYSGGAVKYTAFMNSDGSGGSGDALTYWGTDPVTHRDPNVAVSRRLDIAEAKLKEKLKNLELVMKSLGIF